MIINIAYLLILFIYLFLLFLGLCEQEQQSRKEKPIQVLENQKLQRCRFLSIQALDADEAGQVDIAVDLYMQAVQLSLDVVSFFFCSEYLAASKINFMKLCIKFRLAYIYFKLIFKFL